MRVDSARSIQEIFSQVPKTYELLNKTLTMGLDGHWRKRAGDLAARGGGARWLDVASGTGQMASYLARKGKEASVIALDFSLPMLRETWRKKCGYAVSLCIADASNLPFRENSFDLVTISFGTRNINTSEEGLLRCLKEFHRVLRPQGRFVNLETSQPPSRIVKRLFHIYVGIFVKPIGRFISGSKKAYAYLSFTIRRFFDAEKFAAFLRKAGFSDVEYSYMTLGVVAIHIGYKCKSVRIPSP